MTTSSWPALLRRLLRGEALTADESGWAMNEIMEGAASPAQIAGFGIALRAKGETAEEMSGIATSMLAHATPITIPGPVTDLVGTGGDGAQTVNISTMATIVAAASGVRMVKHGNRAASSSCGAADVLEELGIVIDLTPEASESLFQELGLVFLFASLYHPSFRHAGPVRRDLGVPTFFNYLGPLTNPARPTSVAVGVADPVVGPMLAATFAARGTTALVFHGGGIDELTTTGSSSVWLVSGRSVTAAEFDPLTVGLPRATLADLRGGDAPRNAGVARAVLAGERGPVRDIVLLNAAAAIVASEGVAFAAPGATGDAAEGLSKALADGITRAAQAVDSGAATDLLQRWTIASNRLATPRQRLFLTHRIFPLVSGRSDPPHALVAPALVPRLSLLGYRGGAPFGSRGGSSVRTALRPFGSRVTRARP
ncbi:MAG TPA: anthranilate phosphoribosyltransferase [Trebonia sp.]|jgi:anthranilate phosphoribosyltransferase